MKKIIASPGAIDQLNDDLFIIQNKDYAEQAIASGEFVKWKGVGYVANTAIAIGDSFGANLTELSKGALNSLFSKIGNVPNGKTVEGQIDEINIELGKRIESLYSDYHDAPWSDSYVSTINRGAILFVNAYTGNVNDSGMYLLTLSSGTGVVIPIKEANGATISVSGRTVSFTTTNHYTRFTIYSY